MPVRYRESSFGNSVLLLSLPHIFWKRRVNLYFSSLVRFVVSLIGYWMPWRIWLFLEFLCPDCEMLSEGLLPSCKLPAGSR